MSCTGSLNNIEQYSIETLMSNNRSSGGYFSKDAKKLIYSSDKSGIFNIYEVDLKTNEETQLTDSKEESFFARGYSPTTGEVIYSADKGGNENSHIYIIRDGKSIDLTPGKNTKASFFGWTDDESEMYVISNSRDPRFFDLYKIDIETLSTEMVFKNDRGYNINSISNNDNYLVLSLNISRSEQKLFLFDNKLLRSILKPPLKTAVWQLCAQVRSRFVLGTLDSKRIHNDEFCEKFAHLDAGHAGALQAIMCKAI